MDTADITSGPADITSEPLTPQELDIYVQSIDTQTTVIDIIKNVFDAHKRGDMTIEAFIDILSRTITYEFIIDCLQYPVPNKPRTIPIPDRIYDKDHIDAEIVKIVYKNIRKVLDKAKTEPSVLGIQHGGATQAFKDLSREQKIGRIFVSMTMGIVMTAALVAIIPITPIDYVVGSLVRCLAGVPQPSAREYIEQYIYVIQASFNMVIDPTSDESYTYIRAVRGAATGRPYHVSVLPAGGKRKSNRSKKSRVKPNRIKKRRTRTHYKRSR